MALLKDDWVKEPDQVQLFTLYTMFGGNVERVSVVTRVPIAQIEGMAHDYNWKAKAGGRARLDTEEGSENEKVMNRVSSYANALRLERVFNNLIAELDKDEKFARAFCTTISKDGDTEFSVKNLVDLAKGSQILNDIKYRALGDKLAQEADTASGVKGVAEISLSVYKGLANRFNVSAVDATKQILKAVKADANAPTTSE
jgi:hypothetical protein